MTTPQHSLRLLIATGLIGAAACRSHLDFENDCGDCSCGLETPEARVDQCFPYWRPAQLDLVLTETMHPGQLRSTEPLERDLRVTDVTSVRGRLDRVVSTVFFDSTVSEGHFMVELVAPWGLSPRLKGQSLIWQEHRPPPSLPCGQEEVTPNGIAEPQPIVEDVVRDGSGALVFWGVRSILLTSDGGVQRSTAGVPELQLSWSRLDCDTSDGGTESGELVLTTTDRQTSRLRLGARSSFPMNGVPYCAAASSVRPPRPGLCGSTAFMVYPCGFLLPHWP